MRDKIKDLYAKYGYILYVWVVPVYIGLFFLEESVITADVPYFVSYLPIDDCIPFLEGFIIPYIMWYPFLVTVGIYLLLFDPDTYRRYLTYIGMSFVFVIVICALFPNGQNLRCDLDSLGRDNFMLKIVRWIYSADTNTNVLPSVHVVGSLAGIFAMFESKTLKKRFPKLLALAVGVLISASTVFVKQHSTLDILVAIPYSLLFYVICFKLMKFKKTYRPFIEVFKHSGCENVEASTKI